MVKEAIQSSIVGVGDGVKVIVGIGDGVVVSIRTLGAGNVTAGETGAGWQAVSKIKTNRQMRCFMINCIICYAKGENVTISASAKGG